MSYFVATYDRRTESVSQPGLLLLVREELREKYEPGQILRIKGREYVLSNRRLITEGTVVHYDLILKAGG